MQNQTNDESERCRCGGCFTNGVSLKLEPGGIVIPETQLGYYSGVGRWGWKIDDEVHQKLAQSPFRSSPEREITITCLTCGDSIIVKSSPVTIGKCCSSSLGMAFLRLDPV